jgi:hypothetical protein
MPKISHRFLLPSFRRLCIPMGRLQSDRSHCRTIASLWGGSSSTANSTPPSKLATADRWATVGSIANAVPCFGQTHVMPIAQRQPADVRQKGDCRWMITAMFELGSRQLAWPSVTRSSNSYSKARAGQTLNDLRE